MDEQSRQFAIRLFSTFPRWESVTTLVANNETGRAAFELKVPQPGTAAAGAPDGRARHSRRGQRRQRCGREGSEGGGRVAGGRARGQDR